MFQTLNDKNRSWFPSLSLPRIPYLSVMAAKLKVSEKAAYYPNDEPHPLSLESERRKAMSIIYSAERDSENFYNRYIRNASDDDVDDQLAYLAIMKEKLGIKKWTNFKEFTNSLGKLKEHSAETTATLKCYNDMVRIVSRVKHFDVLVHNVKAKLRKALEEHVHRYCLSFCYAEESKGILAAIEYENNINLWRECAIQGLKTLESKYDDYLLPMRDDYEEYVNRYGQVLHTMTEVIEVIPRIATPLKDWVTADEAYPRKLLDEENKYQQMKASISETLRKRQNNSNDRQSKVKRAGYNTKIVTEKLQGVLMDRRSIRKQEMTYRDALVFVNDEIEMNRSDLQEVLFDLAQKRVHAPRSYDAMTARVEQLQTEIHKLEKRSALIAKRISEIKRDRYRVQKDVHKLQKTFDNTVRMAKRAYDDLDHAEKDTQTLNDELRQLSEKVTAARKVREIKIHPGTIKKVFTYGYTPGLVVDLAGK